MAKKQVRGSAYYEDRLKREHPSVYADLLAGKHRTVTDAAIAAGIKTVRTRLNEMKNAWSKADAIEQREFLRWLEARGVLQPQVGSLPSSSSSVAIDMRLTAAASRRIEEIMSKRNLKSGDVMSEMGYSRLDASVGMAVARGTRLKADVIKALEAWLAANASV